jgi:hypothetical protein
MRLSVQQFLHLVPIVLLDSARPKLQFFDQIISWAITGGGAKEIMENVKHSILDYF